MNPRSATIAILSLLFFLTAITSVSAAIVDGSGFFPVVVTVFKNDGVTPAKGVSIRLADLGEYKEFELDSDKRIKVIPDTLGKPVTTDERGSAVVFYQARWSNSDLGGRKSYFQALPGTLVIEDQKKELFRITLDAWAKENKMAPEEHTALFIVVVLTDK